MEQQTTLTRISKYLFVSTITLFSFGALLGIFTILSMGDSVFAKITATIWILAFLSLFSMNNVHRLKSQQRASRYAAIVALISNFFWATPWIPLLWGVFQYTGHWCHPSDFGDYLQCNSAYYALTSFLWKIIGTAVTFSIVATIVANFINYPKSSQAITILKIITISCSSYLGLYFLYITWTDAVISTINYQSASVATIIALFGLIVTPILVKNRSRKSTPRPTVDETALRAQIEQEVRAQIATEQANQTSQANQANQTNGQTN